MNLDEVKEKLGRYFIEQIKYNDPHVSFRCAQREVSKEVIERHLLNPEELVLAYKEESLGINEEKYELYFKLSSSKTLKLIAVLKEQELYIVTVIVRLRRWKNLVKIQRRS